MFCIIHRNRLLVAVINVIRFIHVRANRNRIVAVERMREITRWPIANKFQNIFLIGEGVYTPFLVRSKVSIRGHQHRQPDFRILGQLNRHQVHIVDGLRIAAHQNRPAGVQRKIQVRMVAVNIQRPGDRAADQVHDHRKPCPRLDRHLLQHV
ncbi:hypothetical protein D3C81_1679960 [compost metagenome]